MYSNIIETNPYKRLTLVNDGNEWTFESTKFANEIIVIEGEPFLFLKEGYHVKDWYCDYEISDKTLAYTIPYAMIVKDGKIGLSLAQPSYFTRVDVYMNIYYKG